MLNPFGFNMLGFIPGVAGAEWIIIRVIIVVVLFGAKKIPDLARSIGRATGELERGKQEIQREIREAAKAPSIDIGSDTEKEKLVKIAKDLNIATEGKSVAELKEEIAKAMKQ
ncbi:MAG: twin-arginine translocase TatA/TatE family subunit [Candidatus Bathyarchaeota archaeon]